MNQPGVSVDWFGAESSGMNITLSDTGGSSIQNVTGGYGTALTGTYQADQTLGTFNNSLANGTWEIYFASQESGGGNAVLNSFTLNIEIIPEPVNVALVSFLAAVLVWTGVRRLVGRERTSIVVSAPVKLFEDTQTGCRSGLAGLDIPQRRGK